MCRWLVGASTTRSLATGTASLLVHATNHNISPPVDEQLVLELKRRVSFTERIDWLPSGLGRGQPCPAHQDVPHAAAQLGFKHLLWRLEWSAVL